VTKLNKQAKSDVHMNDSILFHVLAVLQINVNVLAVCSEIHTKHKNTMCGQNVELLNVKLDSTYSNHWASKFNGAYMYDFYYVGALESLL